MESVVAEIGRAVAKLGLPPDAMRLLPAAEGKAVNYATLHRFVASGDRHFWWEDFHKTGTRVDFPNGSGWKRIADVAPSRDEMVWFIAEDSSLPHFPVFATTPAIAMLVVGECNGFEYYLVAEDLSWLLCETHHNALIGVGDAIESRLCSLG